MELLKINYENDRPTVSARELHEFLEVRTQFKDWFPRLCEYGFIENIDFNVLIFERVQIEGEREVRREVQDYQLTIEMAKEICMLQRNEKGKIAKTYFIQLEKDWNSPEKVMARALQIANQKINTLQLENSSLKVDNTIMKPKADYFDELVDRNLLTNFRDTAKQLNIKEKEFIKLLIDKKYIYRDKKGELVPYSNKNNGLFELKECFNEKTNWAGTQTLVTPKGRETFRLLYLGA